MRRWFQSIIRYPTLHWLCILCKSFSNSFYSSLSALLSFFFFLGTKASLKIVPVGSWMPLVFRRYTSSSFPLEIPPSLPPLSSMYLMKIRFVITFNSFNVSHNKAERATLGCKKWFECSCSTVNDSWRQMLDFWRDTLRKNKGMWGMES